MVRGQGRETLAKQSLVDYLGTLWNLALSRNIMKDQIIWNLNKTNKQKKRQELEIILIFQNFCLFYSQERINISLGCPFCLLPENIFFWRIKNSSAVALIPCSNPKPWEIHQFSKALEGGARSRGSGTAS